MRLLCYCACVLHISKYSVFLWVVLTNTGIFLRGLKLCRESRTQRVLFVSKKKIGGNDGFFRENKASIWKKTPYIACALLLFRITVAPLLQLSFWIPVAHSKICFSRHERRKNTSVVGTVLKSTVLVFNWNSFLKNVTDVSSLSIFRKTFQVSTLVSANLVKHTRKHLFYYKQ